MIEYHQLMARVIYLTATLETAFSADDYVSESMSREDDIRNLLHEVAKLVGRAHEKFR